MLPRWSRAVAHLSNLGSLRGTECRSVLYAGSHRGYAKPAVVVVPVLDEDFPSKSPVNLNKLFFSKPCSLALAPDSPLRVEEPNYEGFRRLMLKMMLFYSKQSKSIRAANVIYKRVVAQVDKPAIYEVFNMENTFKMNFTLLVLHMWLCLRRLKAEGKDGVYLGQYLYEIYNHDLELRVSKAGVNLLLHKWMKDLEKIFYGNVVAYETALLPEAKPDELQKIIWKNIFSDDATPMPDNTALKEVQAMTRYVRREASCLALTDKEAMFSGNFMFTSLEGASSDSSKRSNRKTMP